MISALTRFLGSYDPVTTTQYIIDSEGALISYEVVAAGFAGVDWPWIMSAFLLIVVLYSLLRLIGGIFRG